MNRGVENLSEEHVMPGLISTESASSWSSLSWHQLCSVIYENPRFILETGHGEITK